MDPTYNEYYAPWRKAGLKHRLQENLKALFASFGKQLREVCALNLIFERTARESHLSLSSLPIYREILLKVIGTVQPEVIVTFGRKPLSEIKSVIGISEVENVPSGHGKWQIDLVTGQLEGNPIKVIGFPHLSIYTIYNRPEQLEIVRTFAA